MENLIVVLTVDDRGSYRRDENYPNVIFLASVLRWAVKGTHAVSRTTNGITEHFELDTVATISNNSRALDSTAAFLADHIESKSVSIYSKHSRLPLGNAERALVLGKLRCMDGGELGGLIGDDGFGYYLDGRELFIAVMSSSLPVEDEFQKGGVWHRLAWDAPPEWRDSLGGKARHNEGEEGIAGAPKSDEPPLFTKQEILAVDWPMPQDAPTLENILNERPKWVSEACVPVGKPGGGASGSHLWKPAVLAVCLATKTSQKRWQCNKVRLTNLLRINFSDNFAQWEGFAETL